MSTMPTFVAAGAGASVAAAPGDIAVAYPAGIAAGDLLVAQLSLRSSSQTVDVVPSGWSLLYGPDLTTGTMRQSIYYKFADGTESGSVTFSSSGTSLIAGRMYAFRNVLIAPSGTFNEGGGVTATNATLVTAPSVTTLGTNRLVVAFTAVADDNAFGNFTGETGGDYTLAVAEYTTPTGGLGGTLALETAQMAAAGTISGAGFTMAASDPAVTRAFALYPRTDVSATVAVPFEANQGVSKTQAVPYETVGARSATVLLPFETTVLSTYALLDFETTKGVSATASMAVETTQVVSKTQQIPAEVTQGGRPTAVLSYEAIARRSGLGFVTVEAPSPIPLDTTLTDAPLLLDLDLIGGQVELRWQQVSQAVDGYRIYRSVDGGTATLHAEIPVASIYLDTNAPVGHTYSYLVSAFNVTDESPRSNELSVYIGVNIEWAAPVGLSDLYYASLPWPDAQRKLGETGPVGIVYRAEATWHGTKKDPARGAITLVNSTGPLAALVGKRLRLTSLLGTPRTVVVYVRSSTSNIEGDLSLSRRAFIGIALPALTTAPVKVEVLT